MNDEGPNYLVSLTMHLPYIRRNWQFSLAKNTKRPQRSVLESRCVLARIGESNRTCRTRTPFWGQAEPNQPNPKSLTTEPNWIELELSIMCWIPTVTVIDFWLLSTLLHRLSEKSTGVIGFNLIRWFVRLQNSDCFYECDRRLTHVMNWNSISRENIYRREAKLLLLTEIRATAAPLAAWGVTSWLSAVHKR